MQEDTSSKCVTKIIQLYFLFYFRINNVYIFEKLDFDGVLNQGKCNFISLKIETAGERKGAGG